jgi:hypothetical protein
MLNQTEVISVLQDAIYTTILVALPMLGVALVIGLIVSIFQATTQITNKRSALYRQSSAFSWPSYHLRLDPDKNHGFHGSLYEIDRNVCRLIRDTAAETPGARSTRRFAAICFSCGKGMEAMTEIVGPDHKQF